MNSGLSSVWSTLGAIVDAMGRPEIFGVLALFLSLVFCLSGIPKLRRPELAALAISDFGLAENPPRGAGRLLGVSELGLAAALAVSATVGSSPMRAVPVFVAATILAAFSVLILRSLRARESFSCYCFGNSDETISWLTFSRTVALTALAAILAISAAAGASQAVAIGELAMQLVVAASGLSLLLLVSQIRTILVVPHACN